MMDSASISYPRRWLMAIRPKTLPAAASPVIVGCGIALLVHQFKILPAVVILFCSLLIQISANLINDVVDFTRGLDAGKRLGPTRVTQSGLLTPKEVWIGTVIVIFLSIAGGIYLTVLAGFPVIIMGVICLAAAFLYSVGRYSLTNIGLSEFGALIFFGVIGVCGTVYILVGVVGPEAWISSIGVGGLVTNILLVNNIRDINNDRQFHRKNIAVSFGRKTAEKVYVSLIATALLAPVALFLLGLARTTVFLPLLLIPQGVSLFQKLRTKDGAAFNPVLGDTAKFLLFYSLLLAVGLAVGGYYPFSAM